MFGLGKEKENQQNEFIFDLEKELEDKEKQFELKKLIDSRIQMIKSAMRGGEEKEEYDKLGTLLYGYTAVQKVFARVTRKGLSK